MIIPQAFKSFFIRANFLFRQQPESDGSRSGSSLSLRNIPPQVSSGGGGGSSGGTGGAVQSPSHRGVHRSISASNPKPSRRASSGGETLRKCSFRSVT